MSVHFLSFAILVPEIGLFDDLFGPQYPKVALHEIPSTLPRSLKTINSLCLFESPFLWFIQQFDESNLRVEV